MQDFLATGCRKYLSFVLMDLNLPANYSRKQEKALCSLASIGSTRDHRLRYRMRHSNQSSSQSEPEGWRSQKAIQNQMREAKMFRSESRCCLDEIRRLVPLFVASYSCRKFQTRGIDGEMLYPVMLVSSTQLKKRVKKSVRWH